MQLTKNTIHRTQIRTSSFVLRTFYVAMFFCLCACNEKQARERISFNNDWRFFLGDDTNASAITYNDAAWRTLNVPHDWSIEGTFSEDNPTKPAGGALPAGIAW